MHTRYIPLYRLETDYSIIQLIEDDRGYLSRDRLAQSATLSVQLNRNRNEHLSCLDNYCSLLDPVSSLYHFIPCFSRRSLDIAPTVSSALIHLTTTRLFCCVPWPLLSLAFSFSSKIRGRPYLNGAIKGDIEAYSEQTLYIYLGIAGLVGISCGLLLHFSYAWIHSTLHLGHDPVVRGPTAKEYRAASRRKKTAQESMLYSANGGSHDRPPRGRRNFVTQTIHEEVDSDY